MHPQPRVRNKKAHERSHHRFTGFTRPSLRNGFNGLFRALPGDRALLPPSSRGSTPAKLDPSVGGTGPHDFAVRISMLRPRTPIRPSHPAPTFVTIAKRPLSAQDAGISGFDLPDGTSEIFLREGMDRFSCAATDLPVGQISPAHSINSLALASKRDGKAQRLAALRWMTSSYWSAPAAADRPASLEDTVVAKVSGAIKTSGAR
jgi:hypothetical protein